MWAKNQRPFRNPFVSSLTNLTGIIKGMKRIIFVILLFLLAACATGTAVEPTAVPTETAVPPTAVVEMAMIESTAVPTSLPTPTDEPAPVEPTQSPPTEPAPTAVSNAAEVVVEYGRTQEGAFFHGSADAPVTLIDFSDFL